MAVWIREPARGSFQYRHFDYLPHAIAATTATGTHPSIMVEATARWDRHHKIEDVLEYRRVEWTRTAEGDVIEDSFTDDPFAYLREARRAPRPPHLSVKTAGRGTAIGIQGDVVWAGFNGGEETGVQIFSTTGTHIATVPLDDPPLEIGFAGSHPLIATDHGLAAIHHGCARPVASQFTGPARFNSESGAKSLLLVGTEAMTHVVDVRRGQSVARLNLAEAAYFDVGGPPAVVGAWRPPAGSTHKPRLRRHGTPTWRAGMVL